MYPIKFESLYYHKIWGGRDFEAFRKEIPGGSIGESWDISCHQNGMGIVANGKFKGLKFQELIDRYKEEIFGKALIDDNFPLLVKLINSNAKLSVQVHPNDEYSKRVENSYGKTEAWYVIDAKEGAELIIGTNGCTKEEFKEAIAKGNVENYLNRIKVKKGDAFLIDSGLVHSICGGLVIVEIQQNSDITYRVYDYGRPREIHIEKSLEVIDFTLTPKKLDGEYINFNGYKLQRLCENDYFIIFKYIIKSKTDLKSDINSFSIITCIDGEGVINYKGGSENLFKGDSILIPAMLGEYEIQGEVDILISIPK